METNQNTTDEMEIDLGEIFRELWSKALIIIFSALAVALLAHSGQQDIPYPGVCFDDKAVCSGKK